MQKQTEGRARPREDAPRLVLGALWFSPFHSGSAGDGANAPSRGEVGRGPAALRALIPGQGVIVADGLAYPARAGLRGRSNLKTVHRTVFPRQEAGRFSPRPREDAPRLVLGALWVRPPHSGSAGDGTNAPSRGEVGRSQRARNGLSLPSVRGSADTRTWSQPQDKVGAALQPPRLTCSTKQQAPADWRGLFLGEPWLIPPSGG